MSFDVVIIPAKGLRTGKSRLQDILRPGAREALNLEQLVQTVRAAAEVFGFNQTFVVSPCDLVEAVAVREGVRFLREVAPPGLNEALEQARAQLKWHEVRSISVLPVDLPCISGEALENVLSQHEHPNAIIVPDRAGDGTNFLRIPGDCAIPFSYGLGSFAKHFRLLSEAGVVPKIDTQTCMQDDLDNATHLRRHDRYRPFITTSNASKEVTR